MISFDSGSLRVLPAVANSSRSCANRIHAITLARLVSTGLRGVKAWRGLADRRHRPAVSKGPPDDLHVLLSTSPRSAIPWQSGRGEDGGVNAQPVVECSRPGSPQRSNADPPLTVGAFGGFAGNWSRTCESRPLGKVLGNTPVPTPSRLANSLNFGCRPELIPEGLDLSWAFRYTPPQRPFGLDQSISASGNTGAGFQRGRPRSGGRSGAAISTLPATSPTRTARRLRWLPGDGGLLAYGMLYPTWKVASQAIGDSISTTLSRPRASRRLPISTSSPRSRTPSTGSIRSSSKVARDLDPPGGRRRGHGIPSRLRPAD